MWLVCLKKICSPAENVKFSKKAMPDYLWIFSLVKSYELNNLKKLTLKINTAAFHQGDRYVLPFTLNESEEDRSISNSRPVQLLMENCRKDYKRYEELLLVLKDNYPEVSSNVLTSFIHDLVSMIF